MRLSGCWLVWAGDGSPLPGVVHGDRYQWPVVGFQAGWWDAELLAGPGDERFMHAPLGQEQAAFGCHPGRGPGGARQICG